MNENKCVRPGCESETRERFCVDWIKVGTKIGDTVIKDDTVIECCAEHCYEICKAFFYPEYPNYRWVFNYVEGS